MIIEIYGKRDCELCESAKKKVAHLLERWQLAQSVEVIFRDMETEQGAAEGDFYDVFEIPSVLLKKDGEQIVGRWDGMAPPSDELRQRLSA